MTSLEDNLKEFASFVKERDLILKHTCACGIDEPKYKHLKVVLIESKIIQHKNGWNETIDIVNIDELGSYFEQRYWESPRGDTNYMTLYRVTLEYVTTIKYERDMVLIGDNDDDV